MAAANQRYRSDEDDTSGCNETTEVLFPDGSSAFVRFRGVPEGIAFGGWRLLLEDSPAETPHVRLPPAAGSAAWKKEKRLADNRASAARSRALARYHSFDSDRQIAELQRTIVALRDENVTLRSLLLKHAPGVVPPLPSDLPSVQPPAPAAHPSFPLALSAAGSSAGSDTSSTAASDDDHSVPQRVAPARAGRKSASTSVRAQQMQLIAAATAVAASTAARLPQHAQASY